VAFARYAVASGWLVAPVMATWDILGALIGRELFLS
jgi:hypothetical protein